MGGRVISPKRERFVQEYLISGNAADAYRRAGYKVTNDHMASVEASRLLKVPAIAEQIEEGRKQRAERVRLKSDRTLRELKALALSSIEHYRIDEQGNLALAEGAPKDAMRAVQSVKRRMLYTEEGELKGVEVEFKLWGKPESLKLAMTHLGMLTAKVDVTTKGDKLEAEAKQVMIINGEKVEF